MAEFDIHEQDLSSLGEWERWLNDRVTKEFFDTIKARVTIVRDELENPANTLEMLRFKQGEVANARFVVGLPEVIISDLTQKEKEDERNRTAERGD